MFRWALGRL